MHINISMQ